MTIIGVDPHKSVHEACALTAGRPERLRIKATRRDYQKLLAWADRLPDRIWAIEGAHAAGRTHNEAMRCLKRGIANELYRRMPLTVVSSSSRNCGPPEHFIAVRIPQIHTGPRRRFVPARFRSLRAGWRSGYLGDELAGDPGGGVLAQRGLIHVGEVGGDLFGSQSRCG